MAEVDNGDILRIGATWEMESAYEVTNVFHALVQAGGGITYAAAALDVQEYMEDIYNFARAAMSDHMRSDFISLSNATQDTTFGAIAWGQLLEGAIATEQTALGVCLFGWARTLKPRVQIRKYWGVLTESNMLDGLWTSAPRTSMGSAMNVHITPFTAGPALTLQGVAYNRTLRTYALPTSQTTSSEPAYQRRRKRGRGS